MWGRVIKAGSPVCFGLLLCLAVRKKFILKPENVHTTGGDIFIARLLTIYIKNQFIKLFKVKCYYFLILYFNVIHAISIRSNLYFEHA